MPLTPALRRAGRPFAAALLLAAGIAGAHAVTFDPSATGKPVVLEGQLDVLVEDYPDGHSRLRHFLRTSQGRVELKFARKPPQLPSGTRVRVHGQAQGDVLALDGTSGSVEALTTVLPNTMGEQSVAVLLVNFQDDTSQPKTVADANNLVFGTVSNHYQESSFGQTWFKGQTFGWYTIAMSKTACDPYQLASLADQKAAQAGVNLSGFQRRVYMFPKNACTWSGLGNVGGTNTQAWANGVMTLQVVGHELGHNYGLRHAHALDCDSGVFGNSCTQVAYGDAADLMGNGRAGQFNPFEKEQLGWLNDGVSPPIATVAASGRYTIEPYSAGTVGTKALKIPRGTDGSGRKLWYYVEYRQPIGGDSVLGTTGNLTKGVIVRTAIEGDGDSSYQLDMSPGTYTTSFSELADGALAVGQSHVDGTAGVTLTLVATGTSGATLDVTFAGAPPAPTCTRAAPTVTLTGGGTAVAAGTIVGYTLKVTNRDSSACAATTFTLARSVPTGWAGTLGTTSMTLSPGATGSTLLNVASTGTAAGGAYGIGAATSSPVGTLHTANASATYTVAAPASTGTLTDAVGTDKTAYLRGETVAMSALVRNDGVAVAGASVRFTITAPGGAATTLTATSGSDGYARATYRLAKGKGAIGNYALRADATSGSLSATSSTAFSVR